MNGDQTVILTINGGSSSIKFALFKVEDSLLRIFGGELENIGNSNTILRFENIVTQQKQDISVKAADHNEATAVLIDCLEKQNAFDSIKVIGHRIVHGMHHTAPEKITPALLDELRRITGYDPNHLPEEIKLIELFGHHYPTLIQIACFDTSFHASMPAVAKMLALPRRYYTKGIQRYGFHGLSYTYLMEKFRNLAGNDAAQGKIILAHLGSGASIAAVKEGTSMDTSMSFTPAAGLPMGTRSGDIDPGVIWYLMQFEKISPEQFNHLINQESGLLGISETSSDMRELMEHADTDSRAAEAIELFCYQIKKWIGSFAAVLNGLDTLVFSGGIGEHSPTVRSKVCDSLTFLGLELDEIENMKNEAIISTGSSKVTVRVIKTDEELMIARLVCGVLSYSIKSD